MNKTIKFLLVSVLSLGTFAVNADVPAELKEEVKKREKARGGKAMGPRVGKKVVKAFDLYNIDKDEEGNPVDNTLPAIEILLEINAKKAFDRATVDRYIGGMYATIEGKGEVALEYLKKAEQADVLAFKDHAEVLKNLGALSMQQKNFKDSIMYNEKYLEFSLDQDPKVYLSIANAYRELKEYDKVIEPARKSIKYFEMFDKPNQNPYILIMASYFERKMNVEATKAVEDLVKNFPEEKKWWIQLGNFYALIEDYDRSLSTYNVAYKQGFLEKENHYKRLAQLYAQSGVPFKAAQIQEKYIKEGVIKGDEKGLSVLAQTFQNAKEFKKAAEYYGMAAEKSQDASLYRKQANVLMAIEDFKAAKVAFEKALENEPKRLGLVYMGLGEANFYLGNWKEAYDAFNSAKKEKSTARSARGWIGFTKDTARRKGVTL